jgi:hypothetical protein
VSAILAPRISFDVVRRMLACIFLGFSSGLPLLILLSLLQAWLAKSGLNLKTLGLFALVMFPYTWKFLWAPVMDRFHFGRLGSQHQRRLKVDPQGRAIRITSGPAWSLF